MQNFLKPNFWRIFKVLNRARGLESSLTATSLPANSAVVVYMRASRQLLPKLAPQLVRGGGVNDGGGGGLMGGAWGVRGWRG